MSNRNLSHSRISYRGIPQQVILQEVIPRESIPQVRSFWRGWRHSHWVRRWESHVVIRQMWCIWMVEIYSVDVYLDWKPGASKTLHRVSENDQ